MPDMLDMGVMPAPNPDEKRNELGRRWPCIPCVEVRRDDRPEAIPGPPMPAVPIPAVEGRVLGLDESSEKTERGVPGDRWPAGRGIDDVRGETPYSDPA